MLNYNKFLFSQNVSDCLLLKGPKNQGPTEYPPEAYPAYFVAGHAFCRTKTFPSGTYFLINQKVGKKLLAP